MLDLNELTVFIRVVDEGSFTSAGKVLGMPKSRISRMVADLEEKLGCRLLQRTTRQLSLTEVGAAYYNRCRHLVNEILETHEMISDREENPQGLLRIAVPMVMGSTVIGQHIGGFQTLFPDIRIEIVHYGESTNLVQDGFDVGFFAGDMPDSTLIGRKLLDADSVLVASPEYLGRMGKPVHPQDLQNMKCVKNSAGPQDQWYEMVHCDTGESVNVRVDHVVSTNLVTSALGAIISGAGIGQLPFLVAVEHVISGQLVPLFSDWELKRIPISLAYPSRQYLPRKVRAYIDFVVNSIEQLETRVNKLPTVEERLAAFTTLMAEPPTVS
ncbi:LysR family transcriptional regulator [Thalassolituus sp. LLYu03]|uniref:LysR family transcriptional regulator n=1 Tax=Thalassolituus sp. LLYu03 TaxID=3421656 RepID=UPI003D27D24B